MGLSPQGVPFIVATTMIRSVSSPLEHKIFPSFVIVVWSVAMECTNDYQKYFGIKGGDYFGYSHHQQKSSLISSVIKTTTSSKCPIFMLLFFSSLLFPCQSSLMLLLIFILHTILMPLVTVMYRMLPSLETGVDLLGIVPSSNIYFFKSSFFIIYIIMNWSHMYLLNL